MYGVIRRGLHADFSRVKPARLLVLLALLSCFGARAAAQEAAAPDKAAELRRLFKDLGVHRHSAEIFEELVGRYQKNWPDAVIKDYRQKGLFKSLTPDQTAQMEQLIREFGDRLFGEVKSRVTREVVTQENLEALAAPVFAKYLEAGEVTRIADFAETPLGRKFFDLSYAKMREAMLSSMEARGVFNVASSPEEENARADRLLKDSNGGAVMKDAQRSVAAQAQAVASEFTPEELRQLVAFTQSPLGAKVAKLYGPMTAEIMQRNAATYVPRVGKLTEEVFAEQMEFFERRTNEIMKGAGAVHDMRSAPPARRN
jgi:hypothetical protein